LDEQGRGKFKSRGFSGESRQMAFLIKERNSKLNLLRPKTNRAELLKKIFQTRSLDKNF